MAVYEDNVRLFRHIFDCMEGTEGILLIVDVYVFLSQLLGNFNDMCTVEPCLNLQKWVRARPTSKMPLLGLIKLKSKSKSLWQWHKSVKMGER